MPEKFDVVVIGSGPAGYVAAIRAAQLGLSTACVERWRTSDGSQALGGTCLNVGCIPSKALLESSEQYHRISHQAAAHGIKVSDVSMDVGKMIARKNKIVSGLTGGVAMLFKANKVASFFGHGTITAPGTVEVRNDDGTVVETLEAGNIIVATGSVPAAIPTVPMDGTHIVDSTAALEFEQVPGRLGIIGAGVIGLELGSVWGRLGAEVTLLEAMDTFLAACDPKVAREAGKQFKKQGLGIHLGAMVNSAEVDGDTVKVGYTAQGEQQSLEVDRLIVAVGRKPYTDNLCDGVNLAMNERGFIEVDGQGRTSIDNVWAVGDVTPGPMLAHKGSEEGVAVAERIAGGTGHVDFNTIPWVIYTAPEIAWVGQTEAQLKSEGVPFTAGSFPFSAIGRAKAMEDTTGFVKIIAHAETDRILGVHMIGPYVSELISEAVVAMEFQASSEDLARTVHAHPTLSEAVHEAALAVEKRAIHMPN